MSEEALIVEGKNSGATAIVYETYFASENQGWRLEEDFSKRNKKSQKWEKKYLAVPRFDHCGEPKPQIYSESQLVFGFNE